MNAFEADIWCSVYHSGEFSHTATRTQVIHAMNEEQARKKIKLAKERVIGTEPHQLKASAETVYSIRKIGTVVIRPYYVYSNGVSRPVKES